MSKIRFTKRDSLDIVIDDSLNVSEDSVENSLKSITRKRKKFYPRRIQPVKGIQFYDLSILDGNQLSYTYEWPYTLDFSTTGGFPIMTYQFPLQWSDLNSYYQQFLDVIFAVPFNEWTVRFKRINKNEIFEKGIAAGFGLGEDYTSGYLDELEQWTEAGLELNENDLETLGLHFGIYPLFAYFILSPDNPDIKITSELDLDADEVEFQFTNNSKIFLMPSITIMEGGARYYNGFTTIGESSSPNYWADYIIALSGPIPRDKFEELYNIGNADMTLYQQQYAIIQLMKTFGYNFTLQRGKQILISPYDYETTWESLPFSSFPNPILYTPTEILDPGGGIENVEFLFGFGSDLLFHKLVAVVIQNDNIFYVWNIVGIS